jgi:hypothetical protein
MVCEWYYSGTNSVLGSSTVCDGEWYYGAFVSISGTIYLYVNGAYDNATGSYDHFDPCVSVRIGDSYAGSASVDNWGGGIDESRISNVARTAGYIKSNYYNFWDNLITWESVESAPQHYVEGYVKEFGIPVARIVRLHRRSTGEATSETTSAASTGYYYLTTPYSGEHYVASFDDDLGEEYNALIFDKIIPEVIV